MTTNELWLFVPLFTFAVVSCFVAPRIWRGDMLGRDLVRPESDVLAAWVRFVPVGCPLGLGFVVLLGIATLLSPEGGVVPSWYAVILVAYSAIVVAIAFGIVAFNVPSALVPPARRDEEGLYFRGLQRRWRQRRARRSESASGGD